MIEVDIEQLSPDWFKLRGAIPTASNFEKIVTSKGEPSKQQQAYLYQLAGESLIGRKEESYTNYAMQRGIDLEPEAKSFYEFLTGNTLRQVGLCYQDERQKWACSPDGLIDDVGLYELKCPLLHTHVNYLLKGTVPTEYIQQIQGSLMICGYKWADFMSYYPGVKPLIIRVERDERFISKLANELDRFCMELAETIERLKEI